VLPHFFVMKDKLKVIGILILLVTLIIGGTYVDYSMYMRSHPTGDVMTWLWDSE